MDKLLSDSAKTEISKKDMDILRPYHISNWHSEPYNQNQNPAEWRYRTIQSWTNTFMNRSGAPANYWLLCIICMLHIKSYCMWCIEWINSTVGFIWNSPLIFPLC